MPNCICDDLHWILRDCDHPKARLTYCGLGHDERTRGPQPVDGRLDLRFLDWQLAQTPEESRSECACHARAILGDEEFEFRFETIAQPKATVGTEVKDQGQKTEQKTARKQMPFK
jgi:hypothetical protein